MVSVVILRYFCFMIFSLIASFLLGLSKAGIKGPGVAIVGLVAVDFGAKNSTGLLLPLLMFADVLAVIYYNRYADWRHLKKFIPFMMVGVIVASVFGQSIDESTFRYWMIFIIIAGLILLLLRDFYWQNIVPRHRLFSDSLGFSAGFTSMLGNLAGPFANIYFLSQKLEKNVFIATAAWVFLIINWFKFPFHYFMWKTINLQTLLIDVYLIFPLLAGFVTGIYIVKLLSDQLYQYIIYLSTLLGIIMMIWS